MTSITSIPQKPGRVWGVLALIAVLFPLPWVFVLNVLSVVVRSQPPRTGTSAEEWAYGLIAFGGLFFFPLFAILTVFFAIRAVLKPRVAGKVLGWIAIALLVLSIPLIWNGYAVWIMAGAR